jgi:hypothetical protein
LEHFWCMDEPQAYTNSQNSPQFGLGGNHHLPPYSIICDWPQGLHPNVIFPRTPKLGILKFPKLWFPPFSMLISFCANLQLKWGLKQSYNLHQKISKNMRNTSCTHVIQGNSWVVGSQIDILTPGTFFGHNLCYQYSNGSCKPILDV